MNRRNAEENKLIGNVSNCFENNDNKENYLKEVVTPLGDVYILNERTNEKFIKGTQRSDGTFRKTIRVRTDYMPQEENCVYQVKGKILEEQNKSKYVSSSTNGFLSGNRNDLYAFNALTGSNGYTNSSLKNLANKSTERKVPGWNPVNDKENEKAKNLKKKKKKKKKKGDDEKVES
ncbi:hypothetical protein, conserved [Plasmodium gonderi]|uniref:WIBG Mago-binding domain-containing protein n=1 Tax=Plasmodium gonderi TaxID=77519 RepID=A0A1Y1JQS9_PLAGO|nr:hypothetical protein, conserved [Plasmodium gonderi]GAW82823.1 hypothetical protein, conserved [Plasmodium gonderi]